MMDAGVYRVDYVRPNFPGEESDTLSSNSIDRTDYVAIWGEGFITIAQGVVPSEDMYDHYFALERARQLGIPCGYDHLLSASRESPIEQTDILDLIPHPTDSRPRIDRVADLDAFVSGNGEL